MSSTGRARSIAVIVGVLAAGLMPAAVRGANTSAPSAPNDADRAAGPQARAAYERLPVRFEPNEGQIDPAVDFVARGPGYTLYLDGSEAVISLAPTDEGRPGDVVRMRLAGPARVPAGRGSEKLPGVTNYLIGDDESGWVTDVAGYAKVTYPGVYRGIDLVYYGDDERHVEYDFVVAPGADPSVIEMSFEGQRAISVNDGGDLVLSTADGDVIQRRPVLYQEVARERRAVAGAYRIDRDRVGFDVGPHDPSLPLVIDPVLSYSSFAGGTSPDEANAVAVSRTGGFAYITGKTQSLDFPTASPPPATVLQEKNAGDTDVFVAKVATKASGAASLVYATYLGGTVPEQAPPRPAHPQPNSFPDATRTYLYPAGVGGSDNGLGIAVDGAGVAYVTGETTSDDFPTTPNAHDRACGKATYEAADKRCDFSSYNHPGGSSPYSTVSVYVAADAFVTALDGSGSKLMYSSYIGGSSDSPNTDQGPRQRGVDVGRAIAVEGPAAVYITGSSTSPYFPVTDGSTLSPSTTCTSSTCKPSAPFPDAFLVKVDTTVGVAERSSSLVYGGYGGPTGGEDAGTGVAVATGAPAGTVFVSGWAGTLVQRADNTHSWEGPPDGFVAKWDTTQQTPLILRSYGGARDKFGGGAWVNLASGAAEVFGLPLDLGVGDGPNALALADIDGDGHLDVATANSFADNVSIVLGGAEGRFSPASEFFAGPWPTAVAAADFNGDNRMDLAVSTDASSTMNQTQSIAILLGAGGGRLEYPSSFPAAGPAAAMLAGDFNGDGHADVVTANPSAQSISVFSGAGDGRFDPAREFTVGQGAKSLAAGDLNGDGEPDLVVVRDSHVSILMGTGDGGFAAPVEKSTGGIQSTGVALGRFDKDVHLDMAVANNGSHNLSVLLGEGDGTFGAAKTYGFSQYGATSIAGGDFDKDGDIDLVIGRKGSPPLLFNAGDGTFSGEKSSKLAAGSMGTTVATGDFDGDGRADLAMAGSQEGLETGASDQATAIAVDGKGNVYITGRTSSVDLPTAPSVPQPLQRHRSNRNWSGEVDAFVASFDSSLTKLRYATYLGGGGPAGSAAPSVATGIAVDGAGSAFVTGYTESAKFPVHDPLQPARAGPVDAFVAKVNPTGTVLDWSTHLGGGPAVGTLADGDDRARGIAVDDAGNAYIAGVTNSNDFPTVEPLQDVRAGGTDAFLSVIAADGGGRPYISAITPLDGPPGTPVTISGSGFLPNSTVHFGDVAVPASDYSVVSTARITIAAAPVPDDAGQMVGVSVRTPGGSSPSASRARFTYDQGGWLQTESGSASFAGATMTTLDGPLCKVAEKPSYCGKVLLAGGSGGSGATTKTSRLYDPKSATWSPATCSPAPPACPGPLNVARAGHVATLLPDGKVLVVGASLGSSHANTAEMYDPALGTWARTGDLAFLRSGHTATVLTGSTCGSHCGKVLVTGGASGPAPAELLDPVAISPSPDASNPARKGRWAPIGQPMDRARHTATQLTNGKVLVAGGESKTPGGTTTPTSTAILFDPASETWSEAQDMKVPRSRHSATLLQDGRVLVVGGSSSCPNCAFNPVSSAEIYDPHAAQATTVWTLTSSLSTLRYGHTALLLPSGQVLITSGQTAPTSALLAVPSSELFEPGTSDRPARFVPAGRRARGSNAVPVSAIALMGGGKVLIGRQTGFGDADVAEIYTPPPWVTSFGPDSGGADGGAAITVVGGGFTENTKVLFDREAVPTVFLSADNVTGTAPRAKTESNRIRVVENLVGVGTAPGRFRYTGPPSRVTDLAAGAVSETRVDLTFSASGTVGGTGSPVGSYVIKQSRSPIDPGNFDDAFSICEGGACSLEPARVGQPLRVEVPNRRPGTQYYYALKARDGDGLLSEMSNLAVVRTGGSAPADNTDEEAVTSTTVTTTPERTAGGCPSAGAAGSGEVSYPAGYSLVGLPGGTVLGAQSPLYGWLDKNRGDYTMQAGSDPVEAGRGFWAWFSCPRLVATAGAGVDSVSLPLGGYHASMVGNPSGLGPAAVSGHDFAARWDGSLNGGAGGYHLSGYRQAQELAVGEGTWVFSYVPTQVRVARR